MWLWIILSGLLILIAWALWWVLGWGTTIPILATTVVVLGLATIFFVKWLLARRAAQKLEGAIAQQGNQQALNARPERRAEIQELQKQLSAGISALKTSKVGRSGKRGTAALYSMPWYMIIGPPGAGKTTALKHSGLVFPFQGGTGGGVRGVGGTRNCDWWFTNEAILLDTAGRYTTEQDDRDEWLSFLQFLRKYRPNRPINGIIIAISITELLDAGEQQIEATGKKLRARIDEVMTQLQMQVPVYLLFTKVDLIAGFVEFFGDMKKSDRAQPWGATLKLDLPKNEPGKVFDAEFDNLVKQLHARSLRRMVMERSREAREKIYQYPIEFMGLKKQLSDLIAVTFAPNAFQGTPTFRGFYFTSGTQEGKPMDRVLGRMSAAMGIRPAEVQQQAGVESKSYFLHDVFMNIIFPDGDIAARSASEIRRQLLMKFMVAMATLALALILGLPAYRSFSNNKEFLATAEDRATKAAAVNWTDGGRPSEKFPAMKPLLEQLRQLDRYDTEGVPWGMGWGMFMAERTRGPLTRVYVSQMQTAFVVPVKAKLESELKVADGSKYLEHWRLLKLYLMLADIEHLDVEWATGRYTARWVQEMKNAAPDLSDSELKDLARPHVQYYFELLKAKRVVPMTLDKDLIERVRAALQKVPIPQRYYDMFVNSLIDERIDEAGDKTIDNLVFPPKQLPLLFPDRTEVLKYFESRKYRETKEYQQVLGPYTEKGRAAVMELIKNAGGFLEAEAWVVPMTKEEAADKVPKYVNAVSKQYENEYIKQWTEFFADIKVKTPTTAEEAIDLYRVTSTTPYPVARLIEILEDQTQWKSANPLEGNDAIAREANRRFNNRLMMYSQGIRFDIDLRSISKDLDIIPQKFRKTTEFIKGMKAQGTGGDSRAFLYGEITKRLREKIIQEKNKDPALDLRKLNDEMDKARKEAEQLLEGYDETAKALLRPLLLDPLQVGVRPTLSNPGVDPGSLKPGDKPPGGALPAPGGWKMPKVN
ncbi:MAG: type VI secretion system membrane subunit TssM [Myxococcales bacterium]|nr:type VI secretion system membrane subunit TssM [Myxococcales bacterium]